MAKIDFLFNQLNSIIQSINNFNFFTKLFFGIVLYETFGFQALYLCMPALDVRLLTSLFFGWTSMSSAERLLCKFGGTTFIFTWKRLIWSSHRHHHRHRHYRRREIPTLLQRHVSHVEAHHLSTSHEACSRHLDLRCLTETLRYSCSQCSLSHHSLCHPIKMKPRAASGPWQRCS